MSTPPLTRDRPPLGPPVPALPAGRLRVAWRVASPLVLLLLAPFAGALCVPSVATTPGILPTGAGVTLLAQTVAEAAPPALAPSDDVVLRPGDLIRLQVKDEPHLGGEFPVNEDGTVLVPLAGLVPVAGRPFGSVRAEIRTAFAAELLEPVLVITPLVRLAVLGEVRAPGLFPADPTLTLADILATVGGLTPRADEGKISLVRDGEVIAGRLEPGASLLETRLLSGDQIVVGPKGWVQEHMAVLVGAAASVAAAAVTSLIIRR